MIRQVRNGIKSLSHFNRWFYLWPHHQRTWAVFNDVSFAYFSLMSNAGNAARLLLRYLYLHQHAKSAFQSCGLQLSVANGMMQGQSRR